MKHIAPVLVLSLVAVGCSSDDDDDSAAPDSGGSAIEPVDDGVQFTTPDPNGTSDVARLSYPMVRDLSRSLLTGAYLDIYYDIENEVIILLENAHGGIESHSGTSIEGQTFSSHDCPDGGTVDVSIPEQIGPFINFTGFFTECRVGARVLSGKLSRNADPGVFGTGSAIEVTDVFDAFSVDAGENGKLTVTGTTRRYRETYATIPEAPGSEIEISCQPDEQNISVTVNNDISAAEWFQAGVTGSIAVSEYSYQRENASTNDVNSTEENCPMIGKARETGRAKVVFSGYGQSAVDGEASVSTEISLDEAAGVNTAKQNTVLPDTSSVALAATAASDDSVQVDITANGATISFTDRYQFARDAVLIP